MGYPIFFIYIYYMKFLESFSRFKRKPVEDFKGKKETYRFTDIHNEPKSGTRMGTCRECGKTVDIIEHTEEKCLDDSEKS